MELIVDRLTLDQQGERWLSEIDLNLGSGISVLIGPTLAGKTTLMRVLAGLVRPTSGRVVVNGEDVTTKAVRGRSVAFVYQQFINYPSLSVHENIASPLRVASDLSKPEIDARVRELAELMQLTPQLDRRPAELSGGQQQRVAIARALAHRADVVLLDEPLANLDYKLREQLRGELQRIFADSDSVVLYSTADPAEALYFATTTVVMSEGRVEQVGDALDVYRNPATIAVAEALSDPPINLLPAVVRDGALEFAGNAHPLPPALQHVPQGEAVVLGVRPHRVHLDRRSEQDIRLPGMVKLAEVTGSQTYVHIVIAGDHHVVVELDGTWTYEPGATIDAFVDPAAFHAFDSVTGRLLTTSSGKETVLHG